MKRRLVMALVTWITAGNAMNGPQEVIMSKEDSKVQQLKNEQEISLERCDCCDVIKWGDFLLRQHKVKEQRHPLMGNDEEPCCSEVTSDCCTFTCVLCGPQCCAYTVMLALTNAVRSAYPSMQIIEDPCSHQLAALIGTAGFSGYVSLRNAVAVQKKKDW